MSSFRFLEKESLEFKDVNLIASSTTLDSRSEVPIEGSRLVVSGMTSIIGPSFIEACVNLPKNIQPTLHIPRDIFAKENLFLLNKLDYPKDKVFVGVGLDTPELEKVAKNLGFINVLLDVANGYLKKVLNKVSELKKAGFYVISGSVHTVSGLNALANAGCDVIRDGIAPGSVCTTASSTGFTRGKITEINCLYGGKLSFNQELKLNEPDRKIKTLSDGGIKSSADILKAFGSGADYVMTGRLFTKIEEARMHNPKELKKEINSHYTIDIPEGLYFGMASFYGKLVTYERDRGPNTCKKLDRFIEGDFEYIHRNDKEDFLSLKNKLEKIWDGIRSGISYSGHNSVRNFIGNGVFEIKH